VTRALGIYCEQINFDKRNIRNELIFLYKWERNQDYESTVFFDVMPWSLVEVFEGSQEHVVTIGF
jgi:hypothetical protein